MIGKWYSIKEKEPDVGDKVLTYGKLRKSVGEDAGRHVYSVARYRGDNVFMTQADANRDYGFTEYYTMVSLWQPITDVKDHYKRCQRKKGMVWNRVSNGFFPDPEEELYIVLVNTKIFYEGVFNGRDFICNIEGLTVVVSNEGVEEWAYKKFGLGTKQMTKNKK